MHFNRNITQQNNTLKHLLFVLNMCLSHKHIMSNCEKCSVCNWFFNSSLPTISQILLFLSFLFLFFLTDKSFM